MEDADFDSTFELEIPENVDDASGDADALGRTSTTKGRPWVGIHFQCCEVYVRVYRDADATKYVGRCPKCLQVVRLRVGPDGTNSRFFVAR